MQTVFGKRKRDQLDKGRTHVPLPVVRRKRVEPKTTVLKSTANDGVDIRYSDQDTIAVANGKSEAYLLT